MSLKNRIMGTPKKRKPYLRTRFVIRETALIKDYTDDYPTIAQVKSDGVYVSNAFKAFIKSLEALGIRIDDEKPKPLKRRILK